MEVHDYGNTDAPRLCKPTHYDGRQKSCPEAGSAIHTAHHEARKADKVAELQTKQQQLQNQMLLLKATGTDSAGATAETQKIVAEELEKVATELRSAKGNSAQAVEQVERTHLDTQPSAVKASRDLYEPEKADTASPGIYQIEKDEEQGYKISFAPYSEN